MGSGPNRPNNPSVKKRSGGLLTADGDVAAKCPLSGIAFFDRAVSQPLGTRGVLAVLDGDVVFVAAGEVLGALRGPEISQVARCIERESDYGGELVDEDGETAVRFWMV